MVKFSTIIQANERFASDSKRNTGLVCVFAGATSGTGAGTIERMATMVQASTFYVLGRSAARFATQREKLKNLNPSNKIEFLNAEVSLISEVDFVSTQISALEQRVDYLYMSQRCIPLNVPKCFYLLFFLLSFAYADSLHRHKRGPRCMLCPFVLFQGAACHKPFTTPSSIVPAADFERVQRR